MTDPLNHIFVDPNNYINYTLRENWRFRSENKIRKTETYTVKLLYVIGRRLEMFL